MTGKKGRTQGLVTARKYPEALGIYWAAALNVHSLLFPAIIKVMEKRRSAKDGKRTKISTVRKAATRRPAINKEFAPNARRKDALPQFGLSKPSGEIQAMPRSAVDLIIDRATEVLGNKEEAMRWLGTPVRGLDFATPVSLLATKKGQTRVNDILGRMEYGIW